GPLALGNLKLQFPICFFQFGCSLPNPGLQFVVGSSHSLFGPLDLRYIEGNSVNEPWPTVVVANHLGFALKPNYMSVAQGDSVNGAHRLTRKKYVHGIDIPTTSVVGVDLPEPEYRIIQPFFLRKAEYRLDLRAHVGFADAFVEISHKDYCGDLLDKGSV